MALQNDLMNRCVSHKSFCSHNQTGEFSFCILQAHLQNVITDWLRQTAYTHLLPIHRIQGVLAWPEVYICLAGYHLIIYKLTGIKIRGYLNCNIDKYKNTHLSLLCLHKLVKL